MPKCLCQVGIDPACPVCCPAEPTKAPDSALAARYPKYWKLLPKEWAAIDTYRINILFPVNDPSGMLLHARKKLLLPGMRSGEKSMRKDVLEARDTLSRWLEENPED